MLSIIQAAGWPVWPLLATSVIALALIVERWLALRRARVLPPGLLGEAAALATRPHLPEDVLASMEARSPMGRLLAGALRARHLPREQLRDVMEETGRAVAHDLERHLGALSTIAAVAPLMGLFGTVIGMIEIFSGWSPVGGDPAQLARGISIALYNTALGIFIAIPALIFQRVYRARVAAYVLALEQAGARLLDTLRPGAPR